MFGFSRRDKSHKQRASGFLGGAQPPQIEHMSHSAGCTERAAHTTLASSAFSAKLILGENVLCATVQPFRLNRQRKNSEVKDKKGSFCAAEERRDCLGFVASAMVPKPREMLGNRSSCSLCPDPSLFFSLLGWCCELVWPPNAHLVLFGPQVGLWYLACIAAFV